MRGAAPVNGSCDPVPSAPGAERAGRGTPRHVRPRARERVDVGALRDVRRSHVLDDKVDNLLAVLHRKPRRLEELLRGGVRVIAVVERQLQRRRAVLEVHVEDVVVLLAGVRLFPRASPTP